MRKLTLDLEMLAVDTFGTAGTGERRGTAFAHGYYSEEEVRESEEEWTGMDTCYGGSCLETCTFNTCMSCTATREQ